MLRVYVPNAKEIIGKDYDVKYPGCAIFRGFHGTLYMLSLKGVENFPINRDQIKIVTEEINFDNVPDIYASPPVPSMGNDYARINIEWILLPLIKLAIVNSGEKIWNGNLRNVIIEKFPSRNDIKFLSSIPETYVIYSNIMLILTEKCNTFCQSFTNPNLWYNGRLPSPVLYNYADHLGDRVVFFKRTLNLRRTISDENKRSFNVSDLSFIPNAVGHDFFRNEEKYDHEDQIKIGKINTKTVDDVSESLSDINKINKLIDESFAGGKSISKTLLMETLVRRISYMEFYYNIYKSISGQIPENVDSVIDSRIREEIGNLKDESKREAEEYLKGKSIDLEVVLEYEQSLLENKIKNAKLNLKQRINNLPAKNSKNFIEDFKGLELFYESYYEVYNKEGIGYKKLFSDADHNLIMAKFGYIDDLMGQLSYKFGNIPRKIGENFSKDAVIEPDFEEFKKSLGKRIADIVKIFNNRGKDFEKMIKIYIYNKSLKDSGSEDPKIMSQMLKDENLYDLLSPSYETSEKYIERFSAYVNNTLCTEKKRKDFSATEYKLDNVDTSLILMDVFDKYQSVRADVSGLASTKKREIENYKAQIKNYAAKLDEIQDYIQNPDVSLQDVKTLKDLLGDVTNGRDIIDTDNVSDIEIFVNNVGDSIINSRTKFDGKVVEKVQGLIDSLDKISDIIGEGEDVLRILGIDDYMNRLDDSVKNANLEDLNTFVKRTIGDVNPGLSDDSKFEKVFFEWVISVYPKLGIILEPESVEYARKKLDDKYEKELGTQNITIFNDFLKKLASDKLDPEGGENFQFLDSVIQKIKGSNLEHQKNDIKEKINTLKNYRQMHKNIYRKLTERLSFDQYNSYIELKKKEEELFESMKKYNAEGFFAKTVNKINDNVEDIMIESDYLRIWKKLEMTKDETSNINTLKENQRKEIKKRVKNVFMARLNFYKCPKVKDVLISLANLDSKQCETLSVSRSVTEKILLWSGIDKIDIDLPVTDLEKKFIWLHQYRENVVNKVSADITEPDQLNVFLKLLKGGEKDDALKKIEEHIRETIADIRKVNSGGLPKDIIEIDKKIKDLEKQNNPDQNKNLNKLKNQFNAWKNKSKPDQIKFLEDKLKKQKEQLEEKKKLTNGSEQNTIRGINTNGEDAKMRINFFRKFLEYDDSKVTEIFDNLEDQVSDDKRKKWDDDVYKNRQNYFDKYLIQISNTRIKVDVEYNTNINFIIASTVFETFLDTPYKMAREKIIENLQECFPLFSFNNIPPKSFILSKNKELREYTSFKEKIRSSLGYVIDEAELKDVKNLLGYLEGELEFFPPISDLGRKNLSELSNIIDINFHTDDDKIEEQKKAELLQTMIGSGKFVSKYENKTYLGLLTGAKDYYKDEISEGLGKEGYTQLFKSMMGKTSYSVFSHVASKIGKFAESVAYYSENFSKGLNSIASKAINPFRETTEEEPEEQVEETIQEKYLKSGTKVFASILLGGRALFSRHLSFGTSTGIALSITLLSLMRKADREKESNNIIVGEKLIQDTADVMPVYNLNFPEIYRLGYSKEYDKSLIKIISSNGSVFSVLSEDIEKLLSMYENEMHLVYISVNEEGIADLQKVYFRFPGNDNQIRVIDASAVEYLTTNIGRVKAIKMEEIRNLPLITIEKLNSIYNYSKRTTEMELRTMNKRKITYCRLHFL